MTYEDITYDAEVQWFAGQMPVDLYNNTVRSSLQNSVARGVIPELARDFVLDALRTALDEYSRTQAKTEGGRWLRFIARILSLLNPKTWTTK